MKELNQKCEICGKDFEETDYAAWLRTSNHEKKMCADCWNKEKMRRY